MNKDELAAMAELRLKIQILEAENAELKAELEIAIQTLVDLAEASGLTEGLEQMREGKGRLVREGDGHGKG